MKLIKLLAVAFTFSVFTASVNAQGTFNHGYTSASIFAFGSSPIDPGTPLPCGIPTSSFGYWFVYKPTANGTLTVDTIGSSFDTVLAAYTGDGQSYTGLVSVACNDDIGNGTNQSMMIFSVLQGSTNFIHLAGKGSATGSAKINFDLIPSMTTGSTGQIVSSQSQMLVTNVAEPKPCSVACKYTRWVRLDAATTGTLTVDTMGSSFDTVIEAYLGTAEFGYPTSGSIGCNDNAPGSTKSRLTVPVTAGDYVWVEVGGKGTVRRTIKLNYNLAP